MLTSQIFISHASVDRSLAIAVKHLLESAFDRPRSRVSIFCSSDIGDIEGGGEWLPQIMKPLWEAKVCISIMTPQSVHFSPWVICETGGAFLKHTIAPRKYKLFIACANGITTDTVPPPFRSIQPRNLSSSREITTMCREIGRTLGIHPNQGSRELRRVLITKAEKGSNYWPNVIGTLVGNRQDSSPFNFDSLLKDAKTDVFAAGFNLYNIAKSSSYRRRVISFLVNNPTAVVRFLVSNPRKQRHFRAWKLVGANYHKDLAEAIASFARWKREAKRRRVGNRLEIKSGYFVSTTVVCVDAESSEAKLVVTPVIFGRPLSSDRPHMILTRRRQPNAFSYYWDIYKEFFDRAPTLERWKVGNNSN